MKNTNPLERAITTSYRIPLWHKFVKTIKTYDLLKEGDKVCCCISGGKDSMLMALLFKHLHKYSDFPFEVGYIVMDPGYRPEILEQIKGNLRILGIPAHIIKTDIFYIAGLQDKSPCYLCAKMRRGALYRIAKERGYNKIALGHHYDDVIETTLMNMLNAGSFQTMLPKLPSSNYEGMEIIRPMYLVREAAVKEFASEYDLSFIRCACPFTAKVESGEMESKRKQTKELIAWLKDNYSDRVEKNIFASASNVELDKIIGYKRSGELHGFLDDYEEEKRLSDERIISSGVEKAAIEKAVNEHMSFVIDDSLYKELKDEG